MNRPIESNEVLSILTAYPGLSLKPSRGPSIVFEGTLWFDASYREVNVRDSFSLELEVPADFPSSPPVVKEIGGRIPKHEDFHVNPDGSLCLGSDVAIKEGLHEQPTLLDFIDGFVVGFLLNASMKLEHGGPFITGELPHGRLGLISDYQERFGLKTEEEVHSALTMLSLKKRVANRQLCPCGCNRRLGKCTLHHTLNKYRRLAPRSWFARQAAMVRDSE